MIILLALIYILIGALIWVALDGANRAAGATSLGRSVTASVMMIVLWPKVARRWLQGRRGARQ